MGKRSLLNKYIYSLLYDKNRIFKKNNKDLVLDNIKVYKDVPKYNNYINVLNYKGNGDIILIDNSLLCLDKNEEIIKINKYLDNIEESSEFFFKNKYKKLYSGIKDKVILNLYKNIIKIMDKNDIKDIYIVNYDINSNNNSLILELDFLLNCHNKSGYERIDYIYDYMCDYLDEEFNCNNICNFIDNRCISRRELERNNFDKPVIYGCCYTKGKKCKYLDHGCKIKCISCKLFTCRYLHKLGVRYRPKDFLVFRLFFTMKQRRIIDESIYVKKEDIMKKLVK